MTLGMIQIFVKIVEANSLNAAAEQLYISQPTVTKVLSNMEAELGTTLIERHKGYKKIKLTPDGVRFFAIATRLQALVQESKELGKSFYRIRMRFGANNSLYSAYLRKTISQFAKEHPDIALSCRSSYTTTLYQQLEEKKISFAFVSYRIQKRGIEVVPFLQDEYCLLYKVHGKILRSITYDRLKKLDRANEVVFNWDDEYVNWHEQNLSRMATVGVFVEDVNVWKQFLSHECWTIAPRQSLLGVGEEDMCSLADLNENAPGLRTVYFAKRKGEPLPPADREFLKELITELHQRPGVSLNQDIINQHLPE